MPHLCVRTSNKSGYKINLAEPIHTRRLSVGDSELTSGHPGSPSLPLTFWNIIPASRIQRNIGQEEVSSVNSVVDLSYFILIPKGILQALRGFLASSLGTSVIMALGP